MGEFFIKCCDIQDQHVDVTQHGNLETGIPGALGCSDACGAAQL
jgi:hypothetical protein